MFYHICGCAETVKVIDMFVVNRVGIKRAGYWL